MKKKIPKLKLWGMTPCHRERYVPKHIKGFKTYAKDCER